MQGGPVNPLHRYVASRSPGPVLVAGFAVAVAPRELHRDAAAPATDSMGIIGQYDQAERNHPEADNGEESEKTQDDKDNPGQSARRRGPRDAVVISKQADPGMRPVCFRIAPAFRRVLRFHARFRPDMIARAALYEDARG